VLHKLNLLCKAIQQDLAAKNLTFSTSKQTLSFYKLQIEDVDTNDLFNVKVKGIDRCVLEQPGHLQYYYILMVEIGAAIEMIDIELDSTKGLLWKALTENNKRDLSQSDKTNYILNDDTYIALRRFTFVLKEYFNKFEGIVEGLKSQGYSLNSYIRAKQNGIEID